MVLRVDSVAETNCLMVLLSSPALTALDFNFSTSARIASRAAENLSASTTALMPKRPGSPGHQRDRKSTRLNSSHSQISYAVFCLKKKIRSHQLPASPTIDDHTAVV